jgi:DinB superfamily
MDPQTADLPTLVASVNNIATETTTTFGQLTPAQINWKPSADRWSVAQCFEHLLTTNKGYFPVIDSVLAGQKQTLWTKIPVLPKLTGKLLIKSLDPASTRKLKAPKRFQPAQSDIRSTVVYEFIYQQTKIVEAMKATEHLDLERLVIPSPISAAITYSLMDAYRIIVVHEQRHFQQAKRVTEETGFPKF